MIAPITSRVLSMLQVLEEKSRQMNCQDYGLLLYLVNTHMLTSSNVDLEARLCSCSRWQVTEIPYAHAFALLREKRSPREAYRDDYFYTENFKLKYGGVFISIVNMSQRIKSVKDIVVTPPTQ